MLVSSHLMSELQDTADHLVVVGRGRVIADTSVAELLAAASGDRVTLRTTARAEATTVLAPRGGRPSPPTGAGHADRLRACRPSRSWRCSARTRCRSPRSRRTAPPWRRPTWSSPATRSSSGRRRTAAADPATAAADPVSGAMTDARTAPSPPGRDGFAQLLRAEWTKFRTVRGWVIGMVARGAGRSWLLGAGGRACSGTCGQQRPGARAARCRSGPGGEAVTDSFYFVHQPLTGDGSITVRVTSLTGRSSTAAARRPAGSATPACCRGPRPGSSSRRAPGQGSAYAAMMVTGGHGVRMQYDYTDDTRRPGRRRLRDVAALAAADPLRRHAHRLRLGRRHALDQGRHRPPGRAAGDRPGRAVRHLPAVHRSAQSRRPAPASSGGPAQATGAFDHVSLQGALARRPAGPAPRSAAAADAATRRTRGGFQQAGGAFTVTGSGDIAPAVPGGGRHRRHDRADPGRHVRRADRGGRRGGDVHHRRVPARPDPHHPGREPAAGPGAGGQGRRDRRASPSPPGWPPPPSRSPLGAADAARQRRLRLAGHGAHRGAGDRRHRRRCSPSPPSSPSPRHRRCGAAPAAVAAVIVVIVLPYLLATAAVLPAGAADWLLRVTPAAAFAVQQTLSQYPQVDGLYTPVERATSRSRRGPASRCCAAGPRSPWPWRPSCCAGGTHDARAAAAGGLAPSDGVGTRSLRTRCTRSGPSCAPLPGTLAGCCSRVVALTVAVERRRPPRPSSCPSGGLRPGPGQDQPDRGRPRPGGRRHPGGAGDQRRVQHRHDPHHPDRDAAPGHRPGRQGSRRSPAWSLAAGTVGRARLAAGRAADPARPRVHPAHGYPPLSLANGPDAAGRGRLGPLPGPDRAAQPRRRHRRPRLRRPSIGLVLGLLYLFPIIARRPQPALARHLEQIGPMTRRPGHPGHHRPARPAAQPVAGPRRARRLGRRGPARRRAGCSRGGTRDRFGIYSPV